MTKGFARFAREAKGKRAESPILASVHEAAAGLHRIGSSTSRQCASLMRYVSRRSSRWHPKKFERCGSAKRFRTGVAHYLNVRKDAVSKWERGEKRSDGPSLKLLNLMKAKGLQAIA